MLKKKLIFIIIIIIILSFSIFSIVLIRNSMINNGNNITYKEDVYSRLFIPVGNGNYPSFSPEGKYIVYQSIPKYSSEIPAFWIMNFDGYNHTMIFANMTINHSFTSPKFSPDGNKILFTRWFWGENRKNHSIDVLIKNGKNWDETAKHKQIYTVDNEENNGIPIETIYSPDGKKIAYRIFGGPTSIKGIWIMDADGTNRTRLGSGAEPSFSPDGSKIVYVDRKDDDDPQRIWLMKTDGSNKELLTSDNFFNDHPSIIPDGRILFESERSSPHSSEISPENIWIMNDDGSNQVLIVPSNFNNEIGSGDPAINPDGTMIIFNHGIGGTENGFHYVFDSTGEWKDSDGDGVWDGIDGAPDDSDAGYIKEDPFDWSPCGGVIFPMSIMMVAVWGKWKVS